MLDYPSDSHQKLGGSDIIVFVLTLSTIDLCHIPDLILKLYVPCHFYTSYFP